MRWMRSCGLELECCLDRGEVRLGGEGWYTQGACTRVEHSRRNRPISIPKSKPKSVNSNICNETEFRNSALIASTSGVEIRPSGVQISFTPSCCILWSSYRVVRAAMAKDPPASATTLLEAQLIVAKAAASKKQQKKDKAKVSKKSKTASQRKQDKENQDAEPKAEKGNGKNIRIS